MKILNSERQLFNRELKICILAAQICKQGGAIFVLPGFKEAVLL